MITEKRFLLTGGAGFIGSHIADYLVNNNAKHVTVIDNLMTGSMGNINHLMNKNNFTFYLGDITIQSDCDNVTNNIDIICHQAAIGSVPKSINDPITSHNSNVNGFLNILDMARKKGIKRIVYASSSSVYGDDTNLPKLENIIGNPLSPYAITKYIDELYANIYTKLYGMECIGLRYFNVFGPRQNPNGPYAAVIPKFIEKILNNEPPIINGDGTYSRDFTFVKNIVNANINAMLIENNDCYGNVFNIGTGTKTSIIELFNLINKHCNTKLYPIFGTVRIGDPPHSLANINKATSLLKYNPEISFEDGLQITIEFYKNKKNI
jgi:UDP-N-acetylglucosamine 4-epimerase